MSHSLRIRAVLLLSSSLASACASAPGSAPQEPSAAAPAREDAGCRPGEHKQESCNTCTCSEGGQWLCTMKMCATCEPGHDQTCNDEASVSSLWGRCDQGQCVCHPGFELNPDTGRCRPAATELAEPQ